MERAIDTCLYIGLLLTFGSTNEILFRMAKTRLDLVDHSLALWSGVGKSLSWCSSLCTGEPRCFSLLYGKTDKSCEIFSLIHLLDDSAEESDTVYYLIERASNRKFKAPESCADIVRCSGTRIDGEYWLYPNATSGQRVKVYCHNMGTNPTEYITLKHANTFVQHTCTNWIIAWKQCQTDIKPPLKQANFNKIAINFQDMTVNRTDYIFAVLTGNFNLPFGEAMDCNGQGTRLDCHFFGDAVINTRGTGMILDPNIEWGITKNHSTAILDFTRSIDGYEISFRCGGWSGRCGPVPRNTAIKVALTSEFVPDTEAKADVCIV